MPLPAAPVVGGLVFKFGSWLVGALMAAIVLNIPKIVAVGVAAWVFSNHSVGNSLISGLEYFFPTRDLNSDMSMYLQGLNYAQAWFDVAFLLQLVISYWTFVAVLGMTKKLMSFFGMG